MLRLHVIRIPLALYTNKDINELNKMIHLTK